MPYPTFASNLLHDEEQNPAEKLSPPGLICLLHHCLVNIYLSESVKLHSSLVSIRRLHLVIMDFKMIGARHSVQGI